MKMSEKARDTGGESVVTWIALLMTVSYLAVATVYAWNNWAEIVALPPNGVGDALAGLFAPLAFSWLIVGYYLQRIELRLQRYELNANTQANIEQAKHLEVQAALIGKQEQHMLRQLEIEEATQRRGSIPRLKLECVSFKPAAAELVLTNEGTVARGLHVYTVTPGWTVIASWPGKTVDIDSLDIATLKFKCNIPGIASSHFNFAMETPAENWYRNYQKFQVQMDRNVEEVDRQKLHSNAAPN